MTTANVPKEVYPFASADGQSIPYDVLRPTGLLVHSYGIADWTPAAVPEAEALGNFYSEQPCIVSFAATPSNELYQFNEATMLIPAGTMVQCQMPSNEFWILGIKDASVLYVQTVVRWAALALPRQFTRR